MVLWGWLEINLSHFTNFSGEIKVVICIIKFHSGALWQPRCYIVIRLKDSINGEVCEKQTPVIITVEDMVVEIFMLLRQKAEGKRQKEKGRRQKEKGRRKKAEGRRQKEKGKKVRKLSFFCFIGY